LIPVLLDTDIGSDIDDAVALAYLLQEPECDLIGVTTVTGDVNQRAAIAQILCAAAGRSDVPIHCGAHDPLLGGRQQPDVPQYEPVRHLPHATSWPEATAVDFMRQTIRSRPGEVTLLAIGPMTNVALLFALDPEVPRLLRSWVAMSGWFADPKGRGSWNVMCDPIAAGIAFRAPVPRSIQIGEDVTTDCRLSAADVQARFSGPLLGLVLQMAEVWFRSSADLVFHDPLAAAIVFDESLCTFERGCIAVDASNGATRFERADGGAHEVATSVRREAFFDRLFLAALPTLPPRRSRSLRPLS
jgi:purine nucleosidase